jgi:hypothetical protein
VEVLRKQVQGAWKDFTGQEKVVQGELSSLADGQEVTLSAGHDKVQAHHAGAGKERLPGES